MSEVYMGAYDDEVKEHKVFLECGKEGCKEKVVIHIDLPDKIKGLKISKRFPLCRKHLEEMYKSGFFDKSINDPNHLIMIEGIIKYGSVEEWLKNTKKISKDNDVKCIECGKEFNSKEEGGIDIHCLNLCGECINLPKYINQDGSE